MISFKCLGRIYPISLEAVRLCRIKRAKIASELDILIVIKKMIRERSRCSPVDIGLSLSQDSDLFRHQAPDYTSPQVSPQTH